MQNLAEKRASTSPELATDRSVVVQSTVIESLVRHLAALGVERAFGVSGGSVALLFDALAESPIHLHHCRHETGAAFAATEAYFASGKPAVVFATTGPGLLNALTGVAAARWDGAKLILVSGATNSGQRGRWASQETSSYTMPQDALYTRGPLFDFAVRMEHPSELPGALRRLNQGLSRPGGFVAHLSLPMSLQSNRIELPLQPEAAESFSPALAAADVVTCARYLREGSFAIWAGFGATRAAHLVCELAERSGARVFCSPRGKGILPEDHPLYLGVTGLGGHDAVVEHMLQQRPEWLLVLGTRLGEATSFWDRDLLPVRGLIHVDLDPDVPGNAFPDAHTVGIQAEIGHFLEQLLEHFPPASRSPSPLGAGERIWPEPVPLRLAGRSPVRPQVLMAAIQQRIVEGSDATVLAECGNAFAWCNHHLRFGSPGRYRVSTLFGSMGHTCAGVVGAALATGRKAVAVVGDGSMLMSSEISSAAQYRAPAVWVVLNDAGYGMCRDGHRALGLTDSNVGFPRVEFVELARSLGADGALVESEDALDGALRRALAADGPFVVDVRIDPDEASPLLRRFESLIKQGNSKNVAGWEA